MRKYRIEPVYDNFPKEDMYYRIVRTSDEAIIRSNRNLPEVILQAKFESHIDTENDLEIV